MNKSLVSIIIPTFNRSNYLAKCIDTALAQTISCEIIVCDHGSTDNTPDVMARYANTVKYIRREKDFGVHFCWLEAVINASGNFIHFNFDDDWIEPDFIEACLKLMDEDVGFAFTNTKLYYESKNTFSEPLFSHFGSTGRYNIGKIVDYSLEYLISPGCTLIRKQDILDNLFVGKVPFSTIEYKGVGPDLLFTLMLGTKYKKFGFVEDTLSIFRAHNNSITIDAERDINKGKAIQKAYDQSRIYYLITILIQKFRVIKLVSLVP